MKSRDEIKTHLEGWVTYPEHASKVAEMCLEVLLDIREMLLPIANPIVTVEECDFDKIDKLVQKYKDEQERPSLGFTGVFRTPTGDIWEDVYDLQHSNLNGVNFEEQDGFVQARLPIEERRKEQQKRTREVESKMDVEVITEDEDLERVVRE